MAKTQVFLILLSIIYTISSTPVMTRQSLMKQIKREQVCNNIINFNNFFYIPDVTRNVTGIPADMSINWKTSKVFFTLISEEMKMSLQILHPSGEFDTIKVAGLGQSTSVDNLNDIVYLATDNGVYKYKEDGSIELYTALGEDVMYIAVTSDGSAMYIATWPQNRVHKITNDGQKQEMFSAIPNGHGLTIDTRNNIYFVATKTSYILKSESTIPTKIKGLPSDKMTGVFVSRSDDVYAMDENSNLYLVDPENASAKLLGTFSVTGVNTFAMDSADNVLIGVKGGILKFNAMEKSPCPLSTNHDDKEDTTEMLETTETKQMAERTMTQKKQEPLNSQKLSEHKKNENVTEALKVTDITEEIKTSEIGNQEMLKIIKITNAQDTNKSNMMVVSQVNKTETRGESDIKQIVKPIQSREIEDTVEMTETAEMAKSIETQVQETLQSLKTTMKEIEKKMVISEIKEAAKMMKIQEKQETQEYLKATEAQQTEYITKTADKIADKTMRKKTSIQRKPDIQEVQEISEMTRMQKAQNSYIPETVEMRGAITKITDKREKRDTPKTLKSLGPIHTPDTEESEDTEKSEETEENEDSEESEDMIEAETTETAETIKTLGMKTANKLKITTDMREKRQTRQQEILHTTDTEETEDIEDDVTKDITDDTTETAEMTETAETTETSTIMAIKIVKTGDTREKRQTQKTEEIEANTEMTDETTELETTETDITDTDTTPTTFETDMTTECIEVAEIEMLAHMNRLQKDRWYGQQRWKGWEMWQKRLNDADEECCPAWIGH